METEYAYIVPDDIDVGERREVKCCVCGWRDWKGLSGELVRLYQTSYHTSQFPRSILFPRCTKKDQVDGIAVVLDVVPLELEAICQRRWVKYTIRAGLLALTQGHRRSL